MPVPDPVYPALVVAVCLLLAGLTYRKRVLDLHGSALGFFLALIIGLFGHLYWLFLLLIFLITSFVATRYKYSLKEKLQVAEPRGGTRGFASVLANGWVPMVVALLSFENPWVSTFPKGVAAILFLTALSAAAADTIASELGVLSDRAYLITNFSRVKPGTNGGVSALGTAAALGAAVYTSAIGWVVIWFTGELAAFPVSYILIPISMGFIGCNIDSLLGATLENRGKLNKDRVNILSIGAATLMALAVLMLI
ncbi:MAG: DUF92 domain-containing protein [Thermoplasmata archaeon]